MNTNLNTGVAMSWNVTSLHLGQDGHFYLK